MRIGKSRCVSALAAATIGFAGSALALDEAKNEKAELAACEEKICTMANKKDAKGDDLSCKLSKTWGSASIKNGIEKRKFSWSLGDARCGVELAIKRSDLVAALTAPSHSLEFAKQTIKCEVEREKEVIPITIALAPKITFKGGKADAVWINIAEIDGPAAVKGAIWTAGKANDSLGILHGEIVSGLNEFLLDRCPAKFPAK